MCAKVYKNTVPTCRDLVAESNVLLSRLPLFYVYHLTGIKYIVERDNASQWPIYYDRLVFLILYYIVARLRVTC